jgi:hypothetical protein
MVRDFVAGRSPSAILAVRYFGAAGDPREKDESKPGRRHVTVACLDGTDLLLTDASEAGQRELRESNCFSGFLRCRANDCLAMGAS